MKNNQKRKEIVEAANILFYEKGYKSTNLKDIAEICGIKKQSISYYFENKAMLGLAVYDLFSDRIGDTYLRKARAQNSTLDVNTAWAASIIDIIRYYSEDEKAFRFFEEFYVSSLTNVDIVNKELERHSRMLRSLKQPDFDYICSRYASIGVSYYYLKGYLRQYSKSEFTDLYIRMALSAMVKDDSELERICSDAKMLSERLKIKYGPYFYVG